jgi:hypothetical protein
MLYSKKLVCESAWALELRLNRILNNPLNQNKNRGKIHKALYLQQNNNLYIFIKF